MFCCRFATQRLINAHIKQLRLPSTARWPFLTLPSNACRNYASTSSSGKTSQPENKTPLESTGPSSESDRKRAQCGQHSDKGDYYAYGALAFGAFAFSGLMFVMWYDDTLVSRIKTGKRTPVELNKKSIYYSLEGNPKGSIEMPLPALSQKVSKPKKAADVKQYSKPKPVKLPEHVKYLIVGAGTAGFSAFRAIRGADAEAKVLVIGEEEDYPYMRPPLSKELWYSEDPDVAISLKFRQWSGKERHLFFEKDEFYCDPEALNDTKHGGVSVVKGRKVIKIDPQRHEATLDDNTKIKFDKCLLATGGKPKTLKEIENGGEEVMKRVTLYRRVNDFRTLDELAREAESIAIVGGGFLGSELASSLAHKSKNSTLKVIQLFPESGNMHNVLPEYLSQWTTEKLKNDGVNVISNAVVEKAAYESGKVKLYLQDEKTLTVDHVVVAVGIEPNVELAKTSGLEVDPEIGGFRCDAELRARTDVYVAGDCCSFYDQQFGRRRVEHQDHAVITGRLAGENMAGAAKPYTHQSFFWSDLGPRLGYEAIGIIDSSLRTVGVFAKSAEFEAVTALEASNAEETSKEDSKVSSRSTDRINNDYNKGVIFYLRDKRIVGFVFWNLFNRIPIARRILKENTEFDDLNEVAKLFNIHDSPPALLTQSEENKNSEP